MEISRTNGVAGPARLESSRVEAKTPAQPNAPQGVVDRVEVSEAARLAEQVRNLPEMRVEKLADLKKQIESGGYETAERLKVTVDRIMDDLGGKS